MCVCVCVCVCVYMCVYISIVTWKLRAQVMRSSHPTKQDFKQSDVRNLAQNGQVGKPLVCAMESAQADFHALD